MEMLVYYIRPIAGRPALFSSLILSGYLGLFGFLGMLATTPNAWGQELSKRDQSRVARLDKMAESMDEVDVTKKESSGNRQSDGRRQSEVSELKFRFLLCTSGLINDDQDGMLLFPMQVSGFSSTLSPGAKPRRRSGADLVEIRVVFTGLIGQETPKAEIKLPDFKQGSTFPAADLVREEIQRRIERFLPEVEIQGRQRRREKYLRITNQTDQTFKVFVHRRTNRFDPEQGYQWIWTPSEPGQRPQVLSIDPGQSERLTARDDDAGSDAKSATAQRVRIWAENEGGQRWSDHRETDLWLVDKNPDFDDARVYYSEETETFEHAFEPQPGPHLFTERVLRMTNKTPESLSVELEYRATDQGSAAWRPLQFTIPANSFHEPKDELGMRIRAARIRFSAQSDDRRYRTYQRDDLWLVDRVDGQRAYLADAIGEFRYVFHPVAEGVDVATVTASNVEVKDGSKTVGRIRRGEQFDVLERRGAWTRIALQSDGQPSSGWVMQKDLEMRRPGPTDPPADARQRFRATRNNAGLKIGSTTVASIPQGREFDVLEERDGWVRIEVRLDGEVRHGWVRKSDGTIGPANQ